MRSSRRLAQPKQRPTPPTRLYVYVIPALSHVIPAPVHVIPAKAGIHMLPKWYGMIRMQREETS